MIRITEDYYKEKIVSKDQEIRTLKLKIKRMIMTDHKRTIKMKEMEQFNVSYTMNTTGYVL